MNRVYKELTIDEFLCFQSQRFRVIDCNSIEEKKEVTSIWQEHGGKLLCYDNNKLQDYVLVVCGDAMATFDEEYAKTSFSEWCRITIDQSDVSVDDLL